MAGLPKESAKNLAGVEFHRYLEERTMSTRFWCCSHRTSPRAYRLNGMSLNRHIQISHISRRDKICPCMERSQSAWPLSRVAGEKRGARLRWAYEHEKLTNRFLLDFHYYPQIIEMEMLTNSEEVSTVEPVSESTTIRQWAHQRERA